MLFLQAHTFWMWPLAATERLSSGGQIDKLFFEEKKLEKITKKQEIFSKWALESLALLTVNVLGYS